MKAKHFISIALIISASMLLVSCNDLSENVLSYDGQTRISQTVPTINAIQRITVNTATDANGTISYFSNSDTELCASSPYPILDINNDDEVISYSVMAISPVEIEVNGERIRETPTRDLEFYMKPAAPTKYLSYGYYSYPFRLRQRGSLTQYLSPNSVVGFADTGETGDQHYLLGKVLAIGATETDEYPIKRYLVNPQLFYDRGAMPALSDGQCPASLSEKFLTITLDVDGSRVKVLVNDLARDRFLDDLAASLKTGMTVEISLRNARYDASFGGLLDIQPLAVFIVEEP